MSKGTLGERVRYLRREQGLSQEDLAMRVPGASKMLISRIETGNRGASAERIAQLAVALNTTEAYLISGTDETPPMKMQETCRDRFYLHGRPKGRTTVQVYPNTAGTLRALSQKHGITCPEILDQMVTFCLQRMEK